jgi:hypothetical protein
MKRYRWYCPVCGDGILGPKRPGPRNAARICDVCVDKDGEPVQRYCPALDRLRKVRLERKKERFRLKLERLRIRTGLDITTTGKFAPSTNREAPRKLQ